MNYFAISSCGVIRGTDSETGEGIVLIPFAGKHGVGKAAILCEAGYQKLIKGRDGRPLEFQLNRAANGRFFVFDGIERIAHRLCGGGKGEHVGYLNGNPLDLRLSNLVQGRGCQADRTIQHEASAEKRQAARTRHKVAGQIASQVQLGSAGAD